MSIQTKEQSQDKASIKLDKALKNKKKIKFIPLIERDFKDLNTLAEQFEWIKLKKKQKEKTL